MHYRILYIDVTLGATLSNFFGQNLIGIVFDIFCSMKELNEVLPEGLPMGMAKEFEESCRSALLVRRSFIDLRDNFRQAADPSLAAKSRGHFPPFIFIGICIYRLIVNFLYICFMFIVICIYRLIVFFCILLRSLL